MRAVIQRVKEATCYIDEEVVGSIKKGMVVFLAIGKRDKVEDGECLAEKIVNLRIFEDKKGKMNLSLSQIEGGILLIPQFTLYGNCKKGLRPNFMEAASVDSARKFYLKFGQLLRRGIDEVKEGKFGAKMRIIVDNDGPVTLILDSDRLRSKE
ncbi:MAG: D-aminoacyl-tRNA deacylase [Candidatus Aerophobetes bacterium]|nr:D-aminoacyl-tRNA deacylase [Candidatus Aerophobetes bacterium]